MTKERMPVPKYDRAPDGSLMALADCAAFRAFCERVCRLASRGIKNRTPEQDKKSLKMTR